MFNSGFFFKNIKSLNLNFGPQHPAAHGVLRMSLSLNNERVFLCDPHIGLLHRGTENLITTKNPILSLPYFDRLDYVSMLTQEHAYCLALEKLDTSFKPSFSLQKTRVVLDEITRILNHLLAIACHALDVGSMSPIFWSFEERENLMEVYESVSGARMHAAFLKPFNFGKCIKPHLFKKIIFNLKGLPITLSEINSILSFNKIWKLRLKNIGVLDLNTINDFSLSGVLKRSIGVKQDIRSLKGTKYSFYSFIKVKSFFTKNGDSYDRFILRMSEMFESVNLVVFLLNNSNRSDKVNLNHFNFIENTIAKFKIWTSGPSFKKKECFSYIESPKGVFGVSVYANVDSSIRRCKVKSPSYNNLMLLKFLLPGHTLADIITLIGTVDIVFGEIDR